MKNNHKKHRKGLHVLLMFAGLAAVVTVIMLLWNYLIPSIIGWSAINYWQALGLFVLSRLLFGGLGRHGFMMGGRGMDHHRFHEKFEKMSPMERRDFIRQRFENHFSGNKEEAEDQEEKVQ